MYTSQFYIPFNNPHTYVQLSWYEYGIRMVSFRNFNIQRVFHLVISTKYQYVSGITILVLVMILFVDTIHSPIYWSNIDEHLILHTVNSMKLGCQQLACDRNVLTLMINTSILAFPSCELVHGSSQDVHVAWNDDACWMSGWWREWGLRLPCWSIDMCKRFWSCHVLFNIIMNMSICILFIGFLHMLGPLNTRELGDWRKEPSHWQGASYSRFHLRFFDLRASNFYWA